MADQYQLLMFARLLSGGGFIANLTPRAQNWRRTIRLQGGFWQGSFRLTGDAAELASFFYNHLGAHIEERVGGVVTWEGLIYELDLAAGGVRRRRSLETLANHVTVASDTASGTAGTTSTVAEYGRKEEVLTFRNDPTDVAGVALRDRYLAQYGYAAPQAITATPGNAGDAVLDVTVCGYAFTMNWRYVSGTYNTPGAFVYVSNWIGDVIDDDCQLVTKNTITQNTLNVEEVLEGRIRAWDYLQELVSYGDSSGNPWRLWVAAGRRVNYAAVAAPPAYWLRADGLYAAAGGTVTVDPFVVTPGVVRDLQHTVSRNLPSAFLTDQRDILVDEVQVSVDAASRATLALRTGTADSADILLLHDELSARAQARAAAERARQAAADRAAYQADYYKRKAAWEAAHPGVPFTGKEDMPWLM